MAGVSEPIEYYCVFCVHLTPALPRCASHKHVFECLSMHLQSGALARSEWDVPTAEPPLLHFYPAPTVYSLLDRSHLPSRMLKPALPRCASHKHVFECLSMHLQSGALTRSEWDVPTAEPPLLHFYTAATVCSLHARSHLPSGMLTPALMHADACTATLCKQKARSSLPGEAPTERRPHPVRMGRPYC